MQRRFLKNYGVIARPLKRMLSKDASLDWNSPPHVQATAFEMLKAKLIAPHILVLTKKSYPYVMDTEDSAFQLRAVGLLQQDLDDPKIWAPVGFSSKSLTAAKRNYSATERECLSIVRPTKSL